MACWSPKHQEMGQHLMNAICFPGGSDGQESVGNAGDPGSIPGSGRSPGGGHGNPLQYSCLGIPWTERPGRLQSMGSWSQTRLMCAPGAPGRIPSPTAAVLG